MSQQINLFNPVFEQRRTMFAASTMVLAAGVVLAVVGVLAGMAQLRVSGLQADVDAGARQLTDARKRLSEATAEFAPRLKDAGLDVQIAEAERQHTAMQHVNDMIARGAIGNQQGYAETFRALARQTGDGVWLTAVSISNGGRDIGLKGRALDPAMVPGFLNRLRAEPVLQGKAVGNLQIAEAAPIKTLTGDGKEASTPAPYVEFTLQSTPPGVKP